MEVKIITDEKNTLEIELEGFDQSLAQLLAEKLNNENEVEFAAYKLDHPIVANPRVYLKTKKGDPFKLVLKKLAEIRKEIEEFRTKFSDIAK